MSSFSWLDFAESDRRAAMDVIDLFRERDTVDELGIGSVRDTFSDMLFPGTSAIQTRARYFLIIPWIYLRLERKKIESAEIAAEARSAETNLIAVLEESGDTDGIIGVRAKKSLKRLPSMVYWHGLGRLGIRQYPGTRDQYHRSLDAFYTRLSGTIRSDDNELLQYGKTRNWDKLLPPQPQGFPRDCSFVLTTEEAEYLCDRIRCAEPQSFFAFLLDCPIDGTAVDFPWEHADVERLPESLATQLLHARNFSEALHGAPLLYNLMVSQLAKRAEWVEAHGENLALWADRIKAGRRRLADWDLDAFWRFVYAANPRVPLLTKQFINAWINLVRESTGSLTRNEAARELIASREKHLKRALARIANPRALELYQGDAGTRQIDYRWKATVRRMLADIREGLGDAS
jgi:uncharacterized protein DUF6361